MTNTTTINIKPLINADLGASIDFELSIEKPELQGLNFKKPIKGSLTVMRLDECLNAAISKMDTELELECQKCLKKYSEELEVDLFERQFHFNPPENESDICDIFLVDNKNLTLDLSDMLRQEIILHFPSISVCSSSCKGLCSACGSDKNASSCNCKQDDEPENKPLAALKDLLK